MFKRVIILVVVCFWTHSTLYAQYYTEDEQKDVQECYAIDGVDALNVSQRQYREGKPWEGYFFRQAFVGFGDEGFLVADYFKKGKPIYQYSNDSVLLGKQYSTLDKKSEYRKGKLWRGRSYDFWKVNVESMKKDKNVFLLMSSTVEKGVKTQLTLDVITEQGVEKKVFEKQGDMIYVRPFVWDHDGAEYRYDIDCKRNEVNFYRDADNQLMMTCKTLNLDAPLEGKDVYYHVFDNKIRGYSMEYCNEEAGRYAVPSLIERMIKFLSCIDYKSEAKTLSAVALELETVMDNFDTYELYVPVAIHYWKDGLISGVYIRKSKKSADKYDIEIYTDGRMRNSYSEEIFENAKKIASIFYR